MVESCAHLAPSATAKAPTQTKCAKAQPLPPTLAAALQKTHNPALLKKALGLPEAGGLCAGQVYTVTTPITLYRVWNSTFAGSQLGHWWTWQKPQGAIADYRQQNAICYQWSPLDKLTQCQIAAGTQLVIGSGQSARCSAFLAYPVSSQLQIFLANSAAHTSHCQNFTAHWQWQPDRL